MTIKYFVYSILIMTMLFLSLSANAYAGTIKIDAIMEEPDKTLPNTYDLPKDGMFEISNDSKICPSNQCKLIPNTRIVSSPSGMSLGFSEEGSAMTLTGSYRLQDDITNGHFTPKKQDLVEKVSFMFICAIDDIQENLENGTAKYICSDTDGPWGAMRDFNTGYPYTFSASFELRSRHFVFNAEEEQ